MQTFKLRDQISPFTNSQSNNHLSLSLQSASYTAIYTYFLFEGCVKASPPPSSPSPAASIDASLHFLAYFLLPKAVSQAPCLVCVIAHLRTDVDEEFKISSHHLQNQFKYFICIGIMNYLLKWDVYFSTSQYM